jgi:carbamoyl-phosphate synthase large subunit
MNILLTSISRDVNLVHAFQKALEMEGGGNVIAVDASSHAAGLYFADKYALVPKSTSPDFLDVMLQMCKEYEVRLLIPMRDEELQFFSKHKDKFMEIGTFVMVGEEESMSICNDKLLFVKFCNENGFETPTTVQYSSDNFDHKYPLFIRPRFGKASKDIYQIDSEEKLRFYIKHISNPIIQKYIEAPEFTVDLFADFNGRIISAIPRRRLLTVGGESYITQTSNNPLMIEESEKIAKALRLIGHNTIQCFLDEGKVKFIEINPRFGGAAHVGFEAGAPTPLFLIKLLKGETIEPILGKFKNNFVMLRYVQDIFSDHFDKTLNDSK